MELFTKILKWRNWSVVRKAQVIAALLGALTTLSIQLLLETSGNPESLEVFFLHLARELISIPAFFVSSLFGMDKWHTGRVSMPWTSLCWIIANFSAFCALVGTLIGWIVSDRKKTLRRR